MQHLKIIACEVACREIGWAVAHSPSVADLEFLPVGNHDEPKKGHVDLQSRIDAVPAGRYDAILVGYGICNQILNGLEARHTPLVIPRAHDCITFFLGSKERYQTVFNENSGTYFFTAGWIEFPHRRARAKGLGAPSEDMATQIPAITQGRNFAELVAKYGEDNARYLASLTEQWMQSYQQGALIRFDFDRAIHLQEQVAEICRRNGWKMKEIAGDFGLLQRWLDGPWNDAEFLTVPREHVVQPSFDDRIIRAEPGRSTGVSKT